MRVHVQLEIAQAERDYYKTMAEYKESCLQKAIEKIHESNIEWFEPLSSDFQGMEIAVERRTRAAQLRSFLTLLDKED